MQKYILILSFLLFFDLQANTATTLSFKESLELSSEQIVIDGGSISKIVCPHYSNNEANFFRTFKIGIESMKVHCSHDYNGGYYIVNPTTKERIVLAQRDGDEGDSWDKQTIIFKNANKLVLWNINHSLHDFSFECETMTEIEKKKMTKEQRKKNDSSCIHPVIKCSQAENFYEWDEKLNFVKKYEYTGKFPKRKLGPSEKFKKSCKLSL